MKERASKRTGRSESVSDGLSKGEKSKVDSKKESKKSEKKSKLSIDAKEDIDSIFGKSGVKKSTSKKSSVLQAQISKAKKLERSAFLEDGFGDSRGDGKDRKRTDEGYRIFTEKELKLNNPNAGNTDLCPFDCDCCF